MRSDAPRWRRRAFLATACFAAAAPLLRADEERAAPTPAESLEAWRRRLSDRIAEHPGEAAVFVKHLESGESFAHRENETFPTASLVKVPVMIEAYRQAADGKIRLADPVTLADADKAPGSGILTTHFSAGATFPLRDAVRLMIAWSDNTATNLVVDRIGLPATTARMKELGCPETRLHAKVFRRDTSIEPERSKAYGLGSTTAREMAGLIERLQKRELVSPAACDEMLAHLAACQDKALFPRNLPAAAKVRHKTGGVTGVRTDAGVIEGPGGTLVACVLTNKNRPIEGDPIDPGEHLCADVARLAFERFNPPELLRASRTGTPRLSVGDSGAAVAELQRALNRADAGSTPLDVDGEFGPLTRDALTRFQRSRRLAPTGVADEGTWRELRRRP